MILCGNRCVAVLLRSKCPAHVLSPVWGDKNQSGIDRYADWHCVPQPDVGIPFDNSSFFFLLIPLTTNTTCRIMARLLSIDRSHVTGKCAAFHGVTILILNCNYLGDCSGKMIFFSHGKTSFLSFKCTTPCEISLLPLFFWWSIHFCDVTKGRHTFFRLVTTAAVRRFSRFYWDTLKVQRSVGLSRRLQTKRKIHCFQSRRFFFFFFFG